MKSEKWSSTQTHVGKSVINHSLWCAQQVSAQSNSSVCELLHYPLTTHFALVHVKITKCPTCVQKYLSVFSPPLNSPFICIVHARPGTHYPHVTWAHVMLLVQLWCERRFDIEFCGASGVPRNFFSGRGGGGGGSTNWFEDRENGDLGAAAL
jgi:hypothetical protein